MELNFTGEIWYWKGPSPFHFITVPEDESDAIKSIASQVTYGWGVVPVTARIGASEWTTSLFPKAGSYLLPVKDAIRKQEDLELGRSAKVKLTFANVH
jgi:hypothetical protein